MSATTTTASTIASSFNPILTVNKFFKNLPIFFIPVHLLTYLISSCSACAVKSVQ